MYSSRENYEVPQYERPWLVDFMAGFPRFFGERRFTLEEGYGIIYATYEARTLRTGTFFVTRNIYSLSY
jgi:hypothetical protein